MGTKKFENYITPKKYHGLDMDKKEILWSEWSVREDSNDKRLHFPRDLEEIAWKINQSIGADKREKYGYTILFYMFMENKDSNYERLYFEINYLNYEVIYLPAKKI